MTKEMLFKKFDNDVKKRSRIMRFLLVFDQMFNVLLWNGSQDETISSHIARRKAKGEDNFIDNIVCWFLRKIENKHCIKSLGE